MDKARHMVAESALLHPRVLYVEDNAINSKVVRYGLRQSYDVVVAENAQQACREVNEHHDEFVAILMDIELQGSELDGIELTRLFRGTLPPEGLPEYARGLPVLDLPIIIVTAFTERYPSSAFADAGADSHMSKPVDLKELLRLLTEHTHD